MRTNGDTIVLFDVRYWQAWWKIHVEAVSADRLVEHAVRREEYKWAAALKRARDRSGQKTELSTG